ncbi:MAG TPA: ABC transporter substrate-binding protein, partial [Thermoguttaceae bacterium]|nr:ABC transporter substrate-binding protein [Thermoguttaceae bacterium]
AMERFGHDAPDLRFGMELVDLTDLAKECQFRVFREAALQGGRVRAINAPGAAPRYSRKNLDDLTKLVVENFGAKGLAWFKVEADGALSSPIAKNFSPDQLRRIGERLSAKPGDLVLVVADTFEITCKSLAALRKRFGAELQLYDPGSFHFSWVVEFPMFAYDAEEGGWTAMHHPFTSPRPQDLPYLSTDPGRCRAQAYDLVINGYEAGGGTIVAHEGYVAKDKDFNSILTSIKGKDFDVIFIPGYYQEAGLIIKQARGQGIDAPILGADGFDSPVLLELAGPEALNNIYFSNHYSSLDEDPLVQEFIEKFTDKYGSEPNAFHALGYDLGKFIADAIARADSLDPEAIKDALVATKGFVGVTGSFDMGEDHN